MDKGKKESAKEVTGEDNKGQQHNSNPQSTVEIGTIEL